MVTLDQISISLTHPLILLLVGAGLTGILIPLFTKRWEDRRQEREFEVEKRRKELEVKVDIASKMAEVIAHQTANALTSVSRKKKNGMNLKKMFIMKILGIGMLKSIQ